MAVEREGTGQRNKQECRERDRHLPRSRGVRIEWEEEGKVEWAARTERESLVNALARWRRCGRTEGEEGERQQRRGACHLVETAESRRYDPADATGIGDEHRVGTVGAAAGEASSRDEDKCRAPLPVRFPSCRRLSLFSRLVDLPRLLLLPHRLLCQQSASTFVRPPKDCPLPPRFFHLPFPPLRLRLPLHVLTLRRRPFRLRRQAHFCPQRARLYRPRQRESGGYPLPLPAGQLAEGRRLLPCSGSGRSGDRYGEGGLDLVRE